MANDQPITITGNLAGDPELRFTPSGSAVANFTIMFNPRRYDRKSDQWIKGEAIPWRCEAWNQGQLSRAENICNMLKKGDSVIATGVIETKKWETQEGEARSRIQVKVESIGKDLTFHGQAYAANDAPQRNGNGQSVTEQWGTASQGTQPAGGWGNGPENEPPY